MRIDSRNAVEQADAIVAECRSRDPERIASLLGVQIMERDFKKQLGVYKPVLGIPFIFIKADLPPLMRRIVLLHELGHHLLHHSEAEEGEVFSELRLFSLKNDRMEYEANIFAAQVSIPDDEFLELIELGYDISQVAAAMGTDENLVALKVELMKDKGYTLNRQEYSSHFLKG